MVYIACEDMDFIWREQDVAEVERLWREGYDIRVIAKTVRRHVDEVAILIMDRARQGLLRPRPTGVFGKTEDEDKDANQSTEQLLRRMRMGKGRSSVGAGFLSVLPVPTTKPDYRAK